MKRIDRSLIRGAVIGAFSFASTLAAQGTSADTTLQRAVRQQLDTIARDKSAPGYSKRAQARIDSLMKLHLQPLQPPPVNKAPVAQFTVPPCVAGKPCTLISTSTDDKAIASWNWNGCDVVPSCTESGSLATAVYPHEGTRNVTLTVRDAEGLSSTITKPFTVAAASQPPPDTVKPPPDTVIVEDTTGSIAAAAELPRVVPVLNVPAPSRSYIITGDLQRAVDTAKAGDELRLAAGQSFPSIVLPPRQCGSWITITSNTTIPPAGVRVTPTSATSFAKIVTTSSVPAVKMRNPTCGWRFVGVEVAASASAGVVGTSINYGIFWVGDGGWVGGGETQTSLAMVPQDIIIDRVYLHGATTTNSTRCLFINAGRSVVRDSWISDCHADGFDSQAILGCNGPGPTLVENNYIAGATETLLLGGCDPATPDMIPADWTIRRNHFDKPLSWKGVWAIKNCLEFKNARRVLVEANVFSPCTWQAAQAGMAWVIKSSTETCAVCTWEGTKDMTLRFNVVKTAHIGLNIQAIDGSSAGTTASHTERITVEQNIFEQIGTANGIPPQTGFLMLLTHDNKDLRIRHNTFLSNTPGYGMAAYLPYCGGAARRYDIRDNVFAGQVQGSGGAYAISGDAGSHTTALNACLGSAWVFKGNAVSQVEAQFLAAYPAGNVIVDVMAKLGLNADGSLSSTSPAKGKATDGTDPGANVAEVLRKTQGVVQP